VVGVAGTSNLLSGEWEQAGAPHLHGQVIHRLSGDNHYYYFGCGLQQPVVDQIQALDGVLCAVRRGVWETIRYDESTFDGFHLYDVDFTYRAYKAGYRLAVPMDLLLVHFSRGKYDPRWHQYNVRFLQKFAELTNRPHRDRLSTLQVKLDTLEQVGHLHTGLLHFHFGRCLTAPSAPQ
jgi:GT2 family glycosyltransferase